MGEEGRRRGKGEKEMGKERDKITSILDSSFTCSLCFEEEIINRVYIDINSNGASSTKTCPLPAGKKERN